VNRGKRGVSVGRATTCTRSNEGSCSQYEVSCYGFATPIKIGRNCSTNFFIFHPLAKKNMYI
jgi:hypothetical protein